MPELAAWQQFRPDDLFAAIQPAFEILHRKLATGMNADYIPNRVGIGNL
jgi:hypothetical protein